MSKERRLGRVGRALLIGALVAFCRELSFPKQPPEPTSSVLPFGTSQTEFPELSTSTPEIGVIKDLENRMARGEVITEEDLESYNYNLVNAFCKMMGCWGLDQEVTLDVQEMKRVGQEEGIELIALYRTEITNELARHQAREEILDPYAVITVPTPADYRPFYISRNKGFSAFGTLGEKERANALENFNETVIIWASGEFALRNDLSPVVLEKDKEKLRLIQETFEALKISFPQVWSLYRESDIKGLLLLTGEKLGEVTESEKLHRGFSFLYALDKGDAETINFLLNPPLEA